MRVHHVFARRPREDREFSVLRGNERERVALMVNKLRGGIVSRPAVFRRLDHNGDIADHWFRHHPFINGRRAFRPRPSL